MRQTCRQQTLRGRTAPQSALPQYYLSCAAGLTLDSSRIRGVAACHTPKEEGQGWAWPSVSAASAPLSHTICRLPDSVRSSRQADRSQP